MCEYEDVKDYIPPEILSRAKAVVANLLPDKSREVYESAYNKFVNWCNEKNIKSYTESVLIAYFAELSSKLKASTLWAQYSMVKATLSLKNGIDIDKFSKLRTFLKMQNHGYTPKKSRILSKEQVDQFLKCAPDSQYLMVKVVLILGVAGAGRCDELVRLKITDIEDLKSAVLIKILKTKTNKVRSFTVMGDRYLNIYRKYVALRPKNFEEPRFFIRYQNGICHRQVVGIHKISSVAQEVAKFLNLNNAKEFTGHCLRRTSATFLVDAGGDLTCLKRHGGWKSSTVAEGYVEESLRNKKDIAEKILGLDQPSTSKSIHPINTDNTDIINYEDMEEIAERIPEKGLSIQKSSNTVIADAQSNINNSKKLKMVDRSGLFNFQACSNCNFNINITN